VRAEGLRAPPVRPAHVGEGEPAWDPPCVAQDAPPRKTAEPGPAGANPVGADWGAGGRAPAFPAAAD
jgi:hypothetical protein